MESIKYGNRFFGGVFELLWLYSTWIPSEINKMRLQIETTFDPEQNIPKMEPDNLISEDRK